MIPDLLLTGAFSHIDVSMIEFHHLGRNTTTDEQRKRKKQSISLQVRKCGYPFPAILSSILMSNLTSEVVLETTMSCEYNAPAVERLSSYFNWHRHYPISESIEDDNSNITTTEEFGHG